MIEVISSYKQLKENTEQNIKIINRIPLKKLKLIWLKN
jgi:hypothetical protein